MAERIRGTKGFTGARVKQATLIAPYSTMSLAEGLVYQVMLAKGIPFSYRWFDGDAPTVKELVKGWAPEFTLTEYRTVVIVLGGFYGTLPDVVNQAALAQVALEMDGWKLVYLFEADILTKGAAASLELAMPALVLPGIAHGTVRFGPYGMPDLMAKLRMQRAAQTHSRKTAIESQTDRSSGAGRIGRRRYRKRFGGDRVRRGSSTQTDKSVAGDSRVD